ncbi:hypothetical protein OV203_31335 [Nannocystis sp. ILAH1]|uniref:hypothetical protein n=1 Tax=unclassified Nannocystis TaxID=2627009 RepID=UPI00226EFD4F|nr:MULTISPECIES: hypothetical protein [unclassified Nannocystis]MCY0991678.1 hypothetical protein [Nannocystis sp. ILAH1]MCY1067225.1 hypothetical protein [Nannocystis sp. RBIL2]
MPDLRAHVRLAGDDGGGDEAGLVDLAAAQPRSRRPLELELVRAVGVTDEHEADARVGSVGGAQEAALFVDVLELAFACADRERDLDERAAVPEYGHVVTAAGDQADDLPVVIEIPDHHDSPGERRQLEHLVSSPKHRSGFAVTFEGRCDLPGTIEMR